MTAWVMPDEEELYLLALMDDPSGVELAEFAWVDEEQDDGCFRVWDAQLPWYSCEDPFQIDQCSRTVGKSEGIAMRAFSFPFCYPGQEMLVTAPELNHLRPIIDRIEMKLLDTRLSREMLPNVKGKGINRQPHWQARFANGARIQSRLPNKDGKGVKGQHPLVLEADEMQDYPLAGWIELIETLKRGSKGAQWRAHGVPRGGRDKFHEMTQPESGWTVHRIMAMHRPTWGAQEREEKIKTYGGSRQNPDYRRNIYGDHGDATNPVFVMSRLMACTDQSAGSEYNTEVYTILRIVFEQLHSENNPRGQPLEAWIDKIPGTHRKGHELAPKGYSAFYGGMDVGVTNHPSEILLFGQRAGQSKEHLDLLLRVHLQRIDHADQAEVVKALFAWYGSKLKSFGIDRGGVGWGVWDRLAHEPFKDRVHGWTFSDKVIVGYEDPPEGTDPRLIDPEDLAIERNVVEHSTDVLRNDLVDPKAVTLPFDRELLVEWQGQSYTVEKSDGSPYGKRQYSAGKFHCVDVHTEILTGRGWKTVNELGGSEDVLTLDMGRGVSRWSGLEDVVVHERGPERMVEIESRLMSALVTDGHRWPVRTYNSHARSFGPLHYRATMELSHSSAVPIAAPHEFPTLPKHSDELVELMAWFWTEGSAPYGETIITQSRRAHPHHCAKIERALAAVFGPPGRSPRSHMDPSVPLGFWRAQEQPSGKVSYCLRQEAGQVLRALAPQRIPTPDFLRSLTSAQMELFIRTSELGDGNHAPGSDRRAFQHLKDVRQSRMIEMACILGGLGVSTLQRERQESRSGESCTTHLLKGVHRRPAALRREVPFSGLVWCPQTADGNWLARRNGTVYWTGNTLDAGKMMAAAKTLPHLEAMLKPAHAPVLDAFVGAM